MDYETLFLRGEGMTGPPGVSKRLNFLNVASETLGSPELFLDVETLRCIGAQPVI